MVNISNLAADNWQNVVMAGRFSDNRISFGTFSEVETAKLLSKPLKIHAFDRNDQKAQDNRDK